MGTRAGAQLGDCWFSESLSHHWIPNSPDVDPAGCGPAAVPIIYTSYHRKECFKRETSGIEQGVVRRHFLNVYRPHIWTSAKVEFGQSGFHIKDNVKQAIQSCSLPKNQPNLHAQLCRTNEIIFGPFMSGRQQTLWIKSDLAEHFHTSWIWKRISEDAKSSSEWLMYVEIFELPNIVSLFHCPA